MKTTNKDTGADKPIRETDSSRAEVLELITKKQRGPGLDRDDESRLFELNRQLIDSVVRKINNAFGNRFKDSDLQSAAYIGMLSAAATYSPEHVGKSGRRADFKTYAWLLIGQEVTRCIMEEVGIILPKHVLQEISAMNRAEEELTAELMKRPGLQEIANRLGISSEKLKKLRIYQQQMMKLESLEQPLGDDESGDWRVSTVTDPRSTDPGRPTRG